MTTYSYSKVPEPALITAAKAAELDHIPPHFSFGDGVQTGTFPIDTARVEIRKFAVDKAIRLEDQGAFSNVQETTGSITEDLIHVARKIADFVEAG